MERWRMIMLHEHMGHRLQVLVPEGLDARVRKAAQRARVSKGEWVRRAIESALSHSPCGDSSAPDPVSQLSALNGPATDIQQILDEIHAGRR
jgi:hypothetical protein